MKKSILVIGDDPSFNEETRHYLNRLDCETTVGNDLMQEVLRSEAVKYDAVVIHTNLNGYFDGNAVARIIRRKRSGVPPVIIGISDKPNFFDENNMDYILQGLFPFHDLKQIVNRF